jgi:sugar transferase (PEP-CTERM/EpsH1 system associated)
VRVLFLSHRVPYPPDKGDKIRSFRLLEALTKHHDVRLVTHADDSRDLRHVGELRKRCRSVSIHPAPASVRALRSARALFTGRALSFARFHDPAAARDVREILASDPPDVIVVFSAQPAAYVPAGTAAPIVADLCDVDSEKWAGYARGGRGVRRWIYERECRIVRAFERKLADLAARVSVATEREAATFHATVSSRPVAVIPNGVEIPPAAAGRDPAPGLLVFAGAMDYAANVEAAGIAARAVLPLVRREVPGATLRIVGRNPAREVRSLASLPGVEVTGEVASVAAELGRAEASLVPLRIVRGLPNKVLESFAQAVPVVASPAVLEALGATAGEHALAADDPAGMAAAAVRLIRDRGLARRVGQAGRDLAAERFRWDRFENDMLALVEEAAGQKARAWV